MRTAEQSRIWTHGVGLAFGIICVALLALTEIPRSSVIQLSYKDRLPWRSDAPNFSLESVTGDSFELSASQGKDIGVIFMMPTCPYSQELKQHLVEEDNNGLAEHLVFITTGSIEESKQTPELKDLEDKFRNFFTVLQDTAGTTFSAYKIGNVPQVYWVNKLGQIRDSAVGLDATHQLIKYLAKEL